MLLWSLISEGELKLQMGVAVIALAMVACQTPTDPSDRESGDININITNNNGENQNQSGGGGQNACAGITGIPRVAITSTTFSGGKAKVGEPLIATLLDVQVPSTCNPTVVVTSVTPSVCNVPTTLSQNTREVRISPLSPGMCQANICIGSHLPCATLEIEVIA